MGRTILRVNAGIDDMPAVPRSGLTRFIRERERLVDQFENVINGRQALR